MNLVRNPKIIVPTALILLAGAFVGLAALRSRSAQAGMAVQTQGVITTALTTTVTATGYTEGLDQVDVKAKLAATFAHQTAKEGDEVEAGDVLGSYAAGEVTAQLAKAESAAAQARAQATQVARKRELDPQQYAQDLAAAERHLASARLSFEQATQDTSAQSAQADRALKDAEAAFDLLKQELEQGRVTAEDLAEAQKVLDNAQMAFNQNKGGEVYGSSAYLAAYQSLVQARDNVEKIQDALANQDKTIADQLLQAQNRVDTARDQLDQLKNGGAERQIALAQAQLDDAQAALDQVKLQHQLTQTTDDDVAAAQAAARSAEAAYQQALEDYKTPDILSPIDGKVLAVYVKEGDIVAPGTPLFTIGATHDLVVKAKVDEVDIGKVAVGQKAKITSAAYLGQVFEGTVTKLAPRAVRDGNISVFIAEITVKNPDDLLKPGMNVDVEISSNQKDAALALPLEAVLDRGGEKVVFVLDGSVVHQRKVTTGIMTQTHVEITEGIKEGEQVVTGPSDVLAKLKDGDRVKVQK
ncbi:MAG: efflux RND transporter periplasmic adaptor subunit [Bacillota bacterium]